MPVFELWPYAVWGIVQVVLILVTVRVSFAVKNNQWRHTMHYYFDDISKDIIRKRDEEIRQLSSDLEREHKQGESLRGKVRVMAGLCDEAVKEAGELAVEESIGCVFVPLVGEHGW